MLHSFDDADGAWPYWALVQATDGNLYGVTPSGGTYGYGTVFKITPSGALTTLHSFCSGSGCPDGAGPEAGLVQAADGSLYGITVNGGAYGAGTVLKITLSGTLTTLQSFDYTDGSGPYTALVQATDGNFYGTTCCGGANGVGTVFNLTPSGTLTTLYSFCSQSGCTDGRYPYGGLIQSSDGNLYGTTTEGGANGDGTIFKITSSSTLTTLYTFCSQGGCTDGANPYAGLVQATDGNLYGTTYDGGAYNNGTVFEISPSGTLTTLYSFCSQSGCTDGRYPYAALIGATDGNLYGTTRYGGANASGTVFKITPEGTLTTLYSFCSQSGCADGAYPYAGLVQNTNGKFYGITCGAFCGGGTGGYGTVFSVSVGLGPFVETQPTSGWVGAAVRILGTNLTGATTVMFNGHAAVFTVVSSSLITTTVPAGATTGPVEVLTSAGRLLRSSVPFQVPPGFSPESTGGEERE
jgi:uncharacterized repeat protein (TIGR03803 family)